MIFLFSRILSTRFADSFLSTSEKMARDNMICMIMLVLVSFNSFDVKKLFVIWYV